MTDIVFSEVEDEVHKIDGPVKKMEVTVKLQNTTDKLWEELPVYPCFTAHLWKMNRHTTLKEEFLTASIMESHYVRLEPHSEKESVFYIYCCGRRIERRIS